MATTLEELLKRIADSRSAPIPEAAPSMNLGPLSTDTSAAFAALNPQPTPPQFVSPGPVDQSFVNNYAGPAPVAPVERRPGRLEQIAAILGGVGAGLQGRGGEFVEGIRQQRQEPFRRYERQQAQFEDRRARALELAERRSEREAEQTNRILEASYERDYREWVRRNNIRDEAGQMAARQAFEMEKEARRNREEVARQLRAEQRQREIDARQITQRYFTVSKNMALSKEIGAYYSGLKEELSPAAAKLDAAVQGIGRDRMSGAVGGGSTRRASLSNAAGRALGAFNAALEETRGAVQRGDVRGERAARRKLDAAYGRLSQFPGQIERGIGAGWPWAKPAGQQSPAPAAQPQQQPQGKTLTRAEAQALGITDAQARAEGYTITP